MDFHSVPMFDSRLYSDSAIPFEVSTRVEFTVLYQGNEIKKREGMNSLFPKNLVKKAGAKPLFSFLVPAGAQITPRAIRDLIHDEDKSVELRSNVDECAFALLYFLLQTFHIYDRNKKEIRHLCFFKNDSACSVRACFCISVNRALLQAPFLSSVALGGRGCGLVFQGSRAGLWQS